LKIKKITPARKFQVGIKKNNIFIKDVAHISVSSGDEIKIKKKDLIIEVTNWGFLVKNNLIKNINSKFIFAGSNANKIHLLLYKKNKKKLFLNYCKNEKLKKIPIKKII